MREIVPQVGETAETDRLIALTRVRRAAEELLEELIELSDGTTLMVASLKSWM